MNTTFDQIINGEKYTITVPQNRVETLLDRVDRYVADGKFTKAIDAITPFLGQAVEAKKSAPKPTGNKGEIAAKLIEENRSSGRAAVIKILTEALGITYANAHYYVRKAGL